MILGGLHLLGAASRRVAAEFTPPKITKGYLEARIGDWIARGQAAK